MGYLRTRAAERAKLEGRIEHHRQAAHWHGAGPWKLWAIRLMVSSGMSRRVVRHLPLRGTRPSAMHSLLVLRADKLVGCTEGSDEETEFRKIAGR